jgi:hypothetical protein
VTMKPCRVCGTAFDARANRFCSDVCRFTAKVLVEDNGCWSWVSAKESGWYGRFSIRTDSGLVAVPSHRAAYELFVGPIPEGLHIDHLCRNICCVNPDHLEPVTRQENVRRGVAFRKAALTVPSV